MAIKILITLEGSEEVKSSLNEMAKSGEAFMQQFQGLSAKAPFAELTSDLEKAKPAIESGTQVSHGFAESLRVVIPALRLAGVEVGNFAGFSRLASAGLTGLAAAITGAVIVAFANLEEQAKKTKAGLTGLFGSREVGGLAFSLLEQSAKELGISVESLAPAFQSATTAFNRFQQTAQKFKFVAINPKDLPIGNIEKTAEAVANLFKIIRAGGQDEAEASKSAQAFFNALKEGGKLTTQVLDQLPEGAIRLLGEALGKGALSVEQLRTELALTPPSITKIIEALARFGPQAKAAFDADAVKGFRDELNKVAREFTTEFRELTGISFSDFIIGEIKAIADGIRTSIEEFKRIRDALKSAGTVRVTEDNAAAIRQARTRPFSQTDIQDIINAGTAATSAFDEAGFVDAFNKLKSNSRQTAQSISTDWTSFDNRFSQMSNDVVNAGNAMLLNWQQLKKEAQSTPEVKFKFVTPPAPGTSPFGPAATPAITPEQQATQVQNLVNPFQQADQQIRLIWQNLIQFISEAFKDVDFSGITIALVAPFQNALQPIRDVLLQVKQMIEEIIRQAQEAQQAVQNIGKGRPFNTPGFIEVAGGGLIRGPGSSTSDSIPAWLSNREFVQPARAVSYYGVDFMEAIRRLQFPRNILAPKLAEGGMVRAEATRSLTLVLDTHKFALSGKSSVIDALEHHATLQGIASIGRPPGWVR